MLRLLSWIILLAPVLGVVGERLELEFPTVRFPFTLSREIPALHTAIADSTEVFPWFGWVLTVLVFILGLGLVWKFGLGRNTFTPITERRIQRFKSIRRGYVSLLIVLGLGAIASLDHLLVGNEAIIVKHDSKYSFPALSRNQEKGSEFGVEGDAGTAPADYRELKYQFSEADAGDWVMMPLIPYAPTGDTVPATSTILEVRSDGVLLGRDGKPQFGLAARPYDPRKPERMHLRFRYRDGLKDGPADGWDSEANRVYGAVYKKGELVEGSEKWNGKGELADFLAIESTPLSEVRFTPSPPSITGAHKHPLGTTSRGFDVLAYVYGGLQINFKAALVYIPLVYAIGVSVGLLMGYFGGTFDIVIQRIIEIFSNIPFLFVVMIASTAIPERLKESAGLWLILAILLTFGWMGMTYLMRTAALKEKARDYIASSRVIGSSTPRILFKHLLPNSVAILVTLVPFSISALISALTSLDYLGFGLPPKYATWGQLLRDGLDNLSAPWLVTSAFCCLVALLLLITFIGEAVREAFDPKKFSYYR